MAKARVTPLRAVSIPRLELMAAVLGLRLAIRVRELLGITTLWFWTDSTDVIAWLHGQSRRYKPFVSHRVAEMQEKTSPSHLRHVPVTLNPADLASRGANIADLVGGKPWTDGPGFLYQDEAHWPTRKGQPMEELSELASEEVSKSRTNTAVVNQEPAVEPIIDCTRHSRWIRLVRVTSWVLRFAKLLRSPREDRVSSSSLTATEIEEAEMYWIRWIQQDKYREAIAKLRDNQPINSGQLKSLSPFLDGEGLLRVGGRLQGSDLPYNAQHPLIVPPRNHLTTLIVRRVHEDIGKHTKGVNAVLAELRQKYWVMFGREEAKRVGSACVKCTKQKKHAMGQIMAPLPAHRVTIPIRAFARSGVDYGGPYTVRITRNTSAKRWLCLFTCTTSRAVHLEIAFSLDTPSFLNAFSRMVARRGKPELVVSDNGTNFVGAERELAELVRNLDQDRIINDAANQGITWRFNPPWGSHHGGVFEALIKSAKRSLKGEARLSDEELQTAVVEVEGLLNSRPLTYSSNDPKDETILTPNHFLIGQCGGQLAPRVLEE
jgi:hypothetical protein